MNIRIVNTKKFFRTLIILVIIILILLFIGLNYTYSKTELKYKEEYVKEGDTLWSIIKSEYKINTYLKDKDIRDIIKEVKKINNIQDGNIRIGQKILIPTI